MSEVFVAKTSAQAERSQSQVILPRQVDAEKRLMDSCCSGLLSVYYLTVAGIAYSVCMYTRTFNNILDAGLLSVYYLAVAGIGRSVCIYTGTFNYLRVAGDIQLPALG